MSAMEPRRSGSCPVAKPRRSAFSSARAYKTTGGFVQRRGLTDIAAGLERLLRLFALVAFETIVERFETDAEHFRRAGLVTSGKVNRPHDQFAFGFI
jgi:hypothetical protein